MQILFGFFLRLFLGLVTAKFLLRVLGVAGLDYLVGLTLLFTGIAYGIDVMESWPRFSFLRRAPKRERPD